MTAKDRFDELVSGYLDESLDEDGVREINALLQAGPEYAARFTDLSRLHGALRELEGPPLVAGASRFAARVIVASLVGAALLALVVWLMSR